MKNKHHFVPRFYLDAFKSAPRRIHVFGVDAPRQIRDVSLRDQCYRRKLYGQTDELEDSLAQMEAQSATVIRDIVTAEELPDIRTSEYGHLLTFVAFQIQRTVVAMERVNALVDKTIKQVHSRDARIPPEALEHVQIGYDIPVLLALENVPRIIVAISDLRGHLVVSDESAFVTSDNPAFKYNQYCEGIEHAGTAGFASKGLQIILPLAPRACLVLFDPTTYSVPRAVRHTRRTVGTMDDVNALNGIQMVAATQNVYFSDWGQGEMLRQIHGQFRPLRIHDPLVVREYGHESQLGRSLVVAFERTPNVKLKLSFLKLRWQARSVALYDRVRIFRKEVPMPPIPEVPRELRGPAVFSRFLGER